MTDLHLTESEGTLLALVVRAGPMTAYQISKVYELSPVTNYNTSKGKIYPMIRRLKERALLAAEAVETDGRGTELLRSTKRGRQAVRLWTLEIHASDALLEDPLRTRIQSFGLLTREERIEWCARAKAILAEKLEQLEQYREMIEVPFMELVDDGAVTVLKARQAWLDRVLIAMTRLPSDQAPAPSSFKERARSVTRLA